MTSPDRDSAWIVRRRRTTLVRRETWFPGPSAEIEGRRTAIHSSDVLFQAVTVSAGSHHITFSFVPPGMKWALLRLLVALMLVPTARSLSSLRVRG